MKKRGFSIWDFIKKIIAVSGMLVSFLFSIITILLIIGIISLFIGDTETLAGNVALIPISGTIGTGDGSLLDRTGAKSQTIVDWIEDAEEDDDIKAILLEINSPGGSPVGTDEIAQAIRRAEKPTVALIRESGASGAFWIAMAADTVFANRMSVTGSIGVRSSYLEVADLIDDYNITYRKLVAGKYKDMRSRYKELTPEEQEIIQAMLDDLHNEFIGAIAEYRDLEFDHVKKYATGQVFLGKEAKELGFVDLIGGRKESVEFLEEMLNITVELKKFKEKGGFADLFGAAMNNAAYTAGQGFADNMFETATREDLIFIS